MPNEEYCLKKISEAWGVYEDGSAYISKSKVDEIVRLFRHCVMKKSNFNQDEYTLRNIFRNFDTNRDGVIKETELLGLCSKVGLGLNQNELQALFIRLDLNRNGSIEFEEFVKVILEDPYTK